MIRLSYPFSTRTPLYPGTGPVSIVTDRSIAGGDSANTSIISFHSHSGTHIDVPRHFCPGGDSVKDSLSAENFFSFVCCIDIPIDASQPVRSHNFHNVAKDFPDLKGLLVRTGMHRYRDKNPATYCSDHPWVHPEVPAYLRSRFPELRLFGTDTISVSNPRFREQGRECHRAFLCQKNPILLIEDLDLSDPGLITGPLMLTLYPWMNDDLDGVPVLVFAELIGDFCGYRNGRGESS